MRMPSLNRSVVAAAAVVAGLLTPAVAQEVFRHTVTGEDLKIMESSQPGGRDTEAVRSFLNTGVNPYTEVKEHLPKGEETFLSACSGCHGHFGEGKIGPGLNDSYWTYPKNKTDKGLFETIYGGAQGMMGPHHDLELDEILTVMAWVRHLYTGPIEEADWLDDEQKRAFTQFAQKHKDDDTACSGQTFERADAANHDVKPEKTAC
ncbi:cytochrome c-L [Rhodopseudomonas rhenobacensis]|uniref:Cytochrome c-L n=1 Tax=Rhodopseudomonas rhenobacensis TaxID=87461 RepID=A0A7W8DYD2_9BRAD|nr:cytochrome c(L), periplasmic [Rhodopseudomonas rhenobacensis]MBB5047134.1 cytochrome c-L [Rhodopseudomonas rhenobacensis]